MIDYHNLSDYYKISDMKRLDFIISAVSAETLRKGKKRLSILECGCGTGNISRPLSGLGHNMLAIDLDKESIDYARRKHVPTNLEFAVADVCRIPSGGPFDVAVCSEVLEHLESPHEALQAIRGVLVGEGLLIATTPNGYGPWELRNSIMDVEKKIMKALRLYQLARRLWRALSGNSRTVWSTLNSNTSHVQRFTFSKLIALIEGNGFGLESVEHSNFVLPALTVIENLRCLERIDCAVADRLPAWAVSGWYVTARSTRGSTKYSP